MYWGQPAVAVAIDESSSDSSASTVMNDGESAFSDHGDVEEGNGEEEGGDDDEEGEDDNEEEVYDVEAGDDEEEGNNEEEEGEDNDYEEGYADEEEEAGDQYISTSTDVLFRPRIVISKQNEGDDVHFSDIPENVDVAHGVLGWDHVHQVIIRNSLQKDFCSCYCHPLKTCPRDLQAVLSKRQWYDIHARMKVICRKATQKRIQLYRIGIRNPYLKCSLKIYYISQTLLGFDPYNYLGDIDCWNYYMPNTLNNILFVVLTPLLMVCGAIVVIIRVVQLILQLVASFLGCLIDYLMLFRCSGNRDAERDWFLREYLDYPHLDSDAIQDSILDDVRTLTASLNHEFSTLDFGVYNENETRIRRRKNRRTTLFFQVIGITINPMVEIFPNEIIGSNYGNYDDYVPLATTTTATVEPSILYQSNFIEARCELINLY